MFKISQSSTYKWPVTVEVAVSGGRFDKQTFDGEFKRISQSRFNEIVDEIQKDQTSDIRVAGEVLAGWSGVHDDHGQEVPFSDGALKEMLDSPSVAKGVVQAFFESRSGAKRKN